MMNKLHGIIFAYLSNPDLRELTQHRNTCSIPYGGRYRVIDFMLSNMVNAGVSDVGLIVHANYQSLLDHVGSGKDWDLSRKHGGLRILPPFGYSGRREGVYRGRMDALAGVRSYLQYIRQDYVVLAGGDLAVNLPLSPASLRPISPMTRTLPPCAPAALWARPRTATTSPSAPEGGSPTYWCTPPLPRAANPWRSTFSPSSSCSPWWTTVRPTIFPPSAPACSRPWPASSRFAHTSLTAMPPASSPWLVTSPMELLIPEVNRPLCPRPPCPHQGPLRPVHLLRPRLQGGQLPGG